MPHVPSIIAVLLFGAAVGVAELVARYRDAPAKALRSIPAALYIALNAGAAWLALVVISLNKWHFGASGEAVAIWQVFVAGFSAMALFRSSLFNVRIGDTDVPVGPSAFLNIVLGATDRAVDRTRAQARAEDIADIMESVEFSKAYSALPAYCLALMQNLSSEEQEQLAGQIRALVAADMEDHIKVLNLGLLLMNVVGDSVLRTAIDSLGGNITKDRVRPGQTN